jgi:hypothetical protein
MDRMYQVQARNKYRMPLSVLLAAGRVCRGVIQSIILARAEQREIPIDPHVGDLLSKKPAYEDARELGVSA